MYPHVLLFGTGQALCEYKGHPATHTDTTQMYPGAAGRTHTTQAHTHTQMDISVQQQPPVKRGIPCGAQSTQVAPFLAGMSPATLGSAREARPVRLVTGTGSYHSSAFPSSQVAPLPVAEHSAAQVPLASTIIWPDTGASPLASCRHVHKPLASRSGEPMPAA